MQKQTKRIRREPTFSEKRKIKKAVKAYQGDGLPHTVQDTLPFQKIYPDGLCKLSEAKYSRCIEFADISYRLAGEERQKAIFAWLNDLYNSFDPSVGVELTLMTRRFRPEEFRDRIELAARGDRFDDLQAVYIQNRLVCFDIKELGKQLKKLGMLVIQDQIWNRVTRNRNMGKATQYYVDEFHLLLHGEVGAWSAEIWKRFRKWGGCPCGITQNPKSLLASPEIENILDNSDFLCLLNLKAGDRRLICDRLHISPEQEKYIDNAPPGQGLLVYGDVILPFRDEFPKDNPLYQLMTTKPGEVNHGTEQGT